MQMPFFVNPPFLRLPLALPPLQFRQQQHAFRPPPAPALQIGPVKDAPVPQPLCDVLQQTIAAARDILFGNRPGTAFSTASSCSSASSSTSSFASSSVFKHTDRDKRMRLIVELWKQKCAPQCPHC
ncbi:hypothetical protein niasHS_000818 [Heterodera schachtii]|uniref:Uncharacterized protein n=1 Tax=Heterodera schachtii TaxID=97005 RepID=A0ABD2K724_HETSC